MDYCAVGSVLDLVKSRPNRLDEAQIGAILARYVVQSAVPYWVAAPY